MSIRFFDAYVVCKGAEVGDILQLNTNSKSYIWSPTASLDLTLTDIEGSGSRLTRIQTLITQKPVENRVCATINPL